MSTTTDVQQKETVNHLFDALTDGTRRQIVRFLRERSGSVSEATLAEGLAGESDDQHADDDSASTVRQLRVELRHVHLPKLAESGLVIWDDQSDSVTLSQHPAYDTTGLPDLLTAGEHDSLPSALADEQRRAVLAIVESESGPAHRADLARELAAREAGTTPTQTAVDDAAVSLHHRHLPKLEEAGLIEYDANDGTIVYAGPSEVTALLRADA